MGNRNIFDILSDLQTLQIVGNEWNEYRKMMQACVNKFGIERFEPCECSNKSDLERMKCKKCSGVGYIIITRGEDKSIKKQTNKDTKNNN